MRKIVIGIGLMFFGWVARSQDSTTMATAADTAIHTTPVKKPTAQKLKVHKDATLIKDSASARDTALHKDSASVAAIDARPAISVFSIKIDTPLFAHHPFFRFTEPMHYSVTTKKWKGKEALFYCMVALLVFFALIRNGFPKYLSDLFRTYFQTTVKQKQVKEQLLQNPLPSLLLNIFFTLSTGMFVALLFQYFKFGTYYNFWLLYLYSVLGLIGIYALKFVALKFLGWLFQVTDSLNSYIFIVFTTNKIMGILLLPLLILISFTNGVASQAAVSLGIMVVSGLLAYRFFLSFVSIRRQIHIGFLHFLLYLCAFEIIPLLLINKVLFRFLGETS